MNNNETKEMEMKNSTTLKTFKSESEAQKYYDNEEYMNDARFTDFGYTFEGKCVASVDLVYGSKINSIVVSFHK